MEKGINYIELYPELFGVIDGLSGHDQAEVVFFKPLSRYTGKGGMIEWTTDYVFSSKSYVANIYKGVCDLDYGELEEVHDVMNYLQAYHSSELLRTIYQSRL